MNQIKVGAVLNYVIVGLNILTGLLYTPFMLRCLGQNEYGLYSLVASVIAYLTLLDFGFGSAIVRYSAKIRATESKENEWSLYGMFLTAYTVLGFLVTVVGVVLYFNTDRMFDQSMSPDDVQQARIMMALMVANLAVTFPFSVFGSIITAYEKFVFQRSVSILRILLSTVVLITVLLMGFKAVALVVVQTIFSVSTLLLNLIYCRYKLRIKVYFRNFNIPLLKEVMIFSWWNFVGAIVDRIYWSTGQFILGIYSGTVAVAIFSLAVTMMHLYMSLSTSLNSVLLPRITVLATKKENDKEISDLFIRTGRLQFCVIALVSSGFIAFGQVFIDLWAGVEYRESYIISMMFFVILLLPLIQNVGNSILLARGQIKFRSLCYLCISVVCLLFQIIVVRYYGAIGCAACVCGSLFLGQWVVMNLYYYKRQRLDVLSFFKQISSMSICPTVFAIFGYIIVKNIGLDSWSQLVVGATLYVILYIPCFWYFSMGKYEKSQLAGPLSRIGINLR